MKLSKILFEEVEDYRSVDYYMKGGCGIFAIALQRVFPQYELGSYLDDENIEYYDEDEEPIATVVHVFAHVGDRVIDAKGIRTIKAMKDDYWDVEGRVDWNVSEREIREEYSGDDRPLYPVEDNEVQEAVDFIERNRSKYEIVRDIV